jgi:RNA polymerase sigma-70 factor, ECF subfamily
VQDETDAVAALQSGDKAGLHALVRRYQVPALRMAFNLCGNRQTAEDAVGDAFLAVMRHIGTYDRSRPFEPWFYRIVINAVRAAAYREHRLATRSDAQILLRDHPDSDPGPELLTIQSETTRMLLHEIDRLAQKQREVIVLRYYLDQDERAMASILGVPVGTVKWRLFQARKSLRRRLGEREDLDRASAEKEQPCTD